MADGRRAVSDDRTAIALTVRQWNVLNVLCFRGALEMGVTSLQPDDDPEQMRDGARAILLDATPDEVDELFTLLNETFEKGGLTDDGDDFPDLRDDDDDYPDVPPGYGRPPTSGGGPGITEFTP